MPEAAARAVDLSFVGDRLVVKLADGRRIESPLAWFPRLKSASSMQRQVWRLIGEGEGIHWPALDEDVSVAGLLRGTVAPRPKRTPVRRSERRPSRIESALAGLTPTERAILAALFESGGVLTASELRRRVGARKPITRVALSRMLRRASDRLAMKAS